jgi:hypothetical protein
MTQSIDKEAIFNKWGAILGTQSSDNLKNLWENQKKFEENTQVVDTTTPDFSNCLFPVAMRIASSATIGQDLVSVQPIGNNQEEMERIKNEVKTENRDRKIDATLDDIEYKEMSVTEHPDYNGPVGHLFYLDYSYSVTHSSTQSNIP